MIRTALVFACLLFCAGCDTLNGVSNVEYLVTGTATKVALTYQNADGGTSQIASTAPPWNLAFKAKQGDFLYVSAQIIEGTGTVVATIKKGGETFKTSTGSGFAAIATASGSLD